MLFDNEPKTAYRVYDAYRRHNYEEMGDVCQTVSTFYGTGGGNVPIVLQRRFSNVMVSETEVSPTIEAGGGEGGNNLPMILESNQNHARVIDDERTDMPIQRADDQD